MHVQKHQPSSHGPTLTQNILIVKEIFLFVFALYRKYSKQCHEVCEYRWKLFLFIEGNLHDDFTRHMANMF